MWSLFTFLLLGISLTASGAGELPYTFNLSGKLYESPTSNDPLEDSNIEIRVQILNAAKTCVLYDETQFVSTQTSEGHYSIQVGSATGAAKRVSGSDPGNTMERIFQNTSTVLANCSGSMTTNGPVIAAARHLRLLVKPTGASSFETLSPEIPIGTVPSAFVADTLGGLTKDQFLKPGGSGNLNQANLENLFSSSNYPTLTGLLSGSSPSSGGTSAGNYVLTADNGNTNTGEIRFATGATVKAVITNVGDFIANQKIGIGTGAVVPTTDLAFGGDVDRMVGLERNTIANTEGKKLIIEAGGATASSTDKNGGDLYLSSGIATGTGSSKILFETTAAGASGSTDRTPTTKMVLDGAGKLGIGAPSPAGDLELLVTGTGHKGFVNRLLADDAFAAQQVFFKSRGTGPLQTGDAIGNIRFSGFDGTNDWSPTIGLAQSTAAQIRAHSAEPWTPTAHGGYLALATTPMGSTSPADRLVIDSAGNVGVGVGLTPTATLHLRAGRAEESGAPLKFTSGPLLTIPEDGVMEYLTNKLYFTVGANRYQIPFAENTGSLSSVSNISNATGNISINPQVGGSVTVIGAHSTNSTSGAMIVDGGIGVSQNVNVAGSVTSATNYTPQIYGSSSSGGNLQLDGTAHATKGSVLLASSGGKVGIGTLQTNALLTLGPAFFSTANSSTFSSNSGTLPSTIGSELRMASFGFNSANETHLGIYSVRTSAGSSWASTAIGLGIDVDNTSRVNNGALWLNSNGNVGIGEAAKTAQRLLTLDHAVAPILGFYTSGTERGTIRTNVDGLMTFDTLNSTRFAIDGLGNIGIGTTAPDASLQISRPSSTTSEILMSNGTNNWSLKTGTSDNSFRLVDNQWAERLRVDGIGHVGIGTASPTGLLHLAAGATSANSAPLKFTSGPLLTTPESGAMEFFTDKLYFTVGSVRYVIPFNSASGQYTDVSNISNSSGNISMTPSSGAGSVVVSGAVSTSSSSGALIVSGGVGISQNLNVAGNVSSSLMYSPQIYGSSSASGNVRIDGTDHATKGNVLLSTSGGNVGVGTATPAGKLSVYQLSAASSGLDYTSYISARAEQSGTAGMYGLLIDSSVGSIGSGGYKSLAVKQIGSAYSSSTEMFSIGLDGLAYFAGSMGVGTSNPFSKLHIAGPNTNTTDTGLVMTRSVTSGDEAGSAIFHYLNSGSTPDMMVFGVTGDGVGVGRPNDISRARMVLTAPGRLGIGTILPQVPLDVVGSIKTRISPTTATGIQIGSNGTEEPILSFHQSDNSRRFFMQVNSINSAQERLSFFAGPLNNAATQEALTISGSGRVGVGTANPSAGLSVRGGLNLNYGEAITYRNSDAAYPADNVIYQYFDGGADHLQIQPAGGSPGVISFHTGPASATRPTSMVIRDTGNIGIGTANPSEKLSVVGGMSLTSNQLFATSQNNTIGIYLNRDGNASPTGAASIGLRYTDTAALNGQGRVGLVNGGIEAVNVIGNGYVGIGATTPGYPLDVSGSVRASDYLFSSDRRLKNHIQQIPQALEASKKLRGVSFTWKETGKRSIGFIAQEVEKIFPDLVKTDSQGMKSVQYGNITAIILEAMKEYFTKNDADKEALKLRLAKSEKANEEMKRNFEQKLQKLSARLEALEGKASDH